MFENNTNHTSYFKGKKVLVAGGTGLIGRPLVDLLVAQGASVHVASLDDPSRAHPQARFMQADLTSIDKCMEACRGMEYVFNLLGVKGSPAVTRVKPASFFVPTLMMSINMMEAARRCGVRGFLFTSSIGVYGPTDVFREDDTWRIPPSENDRFAGWAKRMGELQAEAYQIEYRWDKLAVVRPANVYGPYDNFDSENAMVIPSLIKRAVAGEDPFVIWGDGTQVRDFIHARDVAQGMLLAMQNPLGKPVNLGSGRGYAIRELVDVVVGLLDRKPKVIYDTSKPAGDKKRLMDIERAKSMGFAPSISLQDGVKETMDWYRAHRHETTKRYDVFNK